MNNSIFPMSFLRSGIPACSTILPRPAIFLRRPETLSRRRSETLTLRRLRGGVEIRVSEFPGGGDDVHRHKNDSLLTNNSSFSRVRESVGFSQEESATPQNSRGEFYPPPQAAEGEKSGGFLKSLVFDSLPRAAGGEDNRALDENSRPTVEINRRFIGN